MDIFDLSIEEFKKEMKKLVDEYTPKELLKELKDCGLEVNQMNEEDLRRNLKIELNKFENKTYFTGETRIDLMIKDVLSVLETKQAEIEILKRDFEIVDQECSRLEKEDIRKDKIIDLMAEYLAFDYGINSCEDIKTLKKQIKEKIEREINNEIRR